MPLSSWYGNESQGPRRQGADEHCQQCRAPHEDLHGAAYFKSNRLAQSLRKPISGSLAQQRAEPEPANEVGDDQCECEGG